ncbi:MAG: CAP domain-containing protein [Hyphomicrobiales bacterium]
MENRQTTNQWVRHSLLIGTLAAILASCAEAPPPAAPTRPAFYNNLESPTAQLDVQDAVRVISTYRVSKGLAPVQVDPELVLLAQSHANAQAKANKVGHKIGGSFSQRVKTLNQTRSVSVENVSAGYRSFAEAFSGWRDSKRHNANLLNQGVTRFGIAKSVNSKSKFKVFWTLVMTGEPIQ